MPTRRVSVKIALDGYEEYRATVTKLNNANKLFASELGIVDQKLKANTDDISALRRQHTVLKDAFDNQKDTLKILKDKLDDAKAAQDRYQKAVESSEAKVRILTTMLENYKNSSDATDDKIKDFEDALAQANRELDENKGYLDAANRGVMDMQTQYNNAKSKLYEYERKLVENQIAQDKANGTWQEGAVYIGLLGTKFTSAGEEADKFKNKTESAIEALAKNKAFEVIKESVDAIKDALMDCVNKSIEFESAMAGVAKTWSGTDEELEQFTETIKNMALRLPSTTTELAAVAEAAGQLGIESKDMEKFVETMVGLGNATNITSDEAAILAAQFRAVNDFGTENIDRFASAVTWLGNNSATTEQNIMAMAQRLAAAGTQAGLSAQDILGVATALSSTGIAAEAGGGSFSKFIVNLQQGVETGKVGKVELKEFAKVAGMSAKEFKEQWGKDPIIAIQNFIDGLAAAGDEGKSAIGILETLGIKEIRMRNALLSLASGENKLTKYVEGSNKAWEDNVALQEEVDKRYNTTESQVKILNNSIDGIKREVGDALVPVIRDLIEKAKPIIETISTFIKENPELIRQIAEITGVLIGLTTGVTVLGKVKTALDSLISGGGLALVPMTMLAIAIAGVVEGVETLTDTIDNYTPTLDNYGQTVQTVSEQMRQNAEDWNMTKTNIHDTREEAGYYLEKLDELNEKEELSAKEQEQYNEYVAKLKELIPGLNIEIDKKTGKIKGTTDAIREQIDEWEKLILIEAMEEQMKRILTEKLQVEQELSENNRKYKEEKEALAKAEEKRNKLLAREQELQEKIESSQEGILALTYEETKEWITMSNNIGKADKAILEHEKNLADIELALGADQDALIKLDRQYNDFENRLRNVGVTADQAADDIAGVGESGEKTKKELQDVGYEAEQTAKSMELVGKTSEEVADKIVEDFGISDDLRRQAGESMSAYTQRLREASIDEGVITKIKNYYINNLPKDFKSQGKSAGQSYVEGIIIGLGTKNTQLKTTAQGIAKIVNGKVTQTWMEKSPSRVAMKYGAYYVEGLQMGMESEKDNLSKEAEKIAKSTNNIMDHSLDSSLIFGNQGSLDLNTSGKQTVQIKQDDSTQKDLTTMVGLMERYLPAFANMQVVMNSGELVGSIAPKIDEYFANEQLAHERGM